MSSPNQEIVHEGWLTKSPPSKRIWRAKWRRRWFVLRQSGELPGQYYLDYYSDRNRRKLKGRIDLDLCDQVDAGLYMERGSGAVLGSRVRGSVFSVRTTARTYHLEADCEADMERWVVVICRVCGLKADEPSTPPYAPEEPDASSMIQLEQINVNPYIHIADCITGARSPDKVDRPRAYTYDGRARNTTRIEGESALAMEVTRAPPADNSDNDSTLSAEERPPVRFTGPPVPPRPAKTLKSSKTFRYVKDGTHGQDEPAAVAALPTRATPSMHGDRDRIHIGNNAVKYTPSRELPSTSSGSVHIPEGRCCSNPSCNSGGPLNFASGYDSDDDDFELSGSMQRYTRPAAQYTNIPRGPPVVNRALKPRQSHHYYNGASNAHCGWTSPGRTRDDAGYHYQTKNERSDKLNYLDLVFPDSKPSSSKDGVSPLHNKIKLDDADSGYKTVDFLKTEAFKITRLDAEALRANAMAH